MITSKQADRAIDIISKSSDEALDYMGTFMENMGDKDYRVMVAETHALEIAVGIAMREHVIPVMASMEKDLPRLLKRNGVKKEAAAGVIVPIFFGRFIKNLVKEMSNGNDS